MRSHVGVGALPILVYFSGDWDVHWMYDLDFDPWPFTSRVPSLEEGQAHRGFRGLPLSGIREFAEG